MSIRIGITAKLFLAILLSCALVALAVSAAVRYSFNQGFLGYLNEQEAQRLELLTPTLAKAYAQHGDWNFLRDNPRQWYSLIRFRDEPSAGDNDANAARRPADQAASPDTAASRTVAEPGSGSLPDSTPSKVTPAAPARDESETGTDRRQQANDKDDGNGERPRRVRRPPTESDLTGLNLRLGLFDAQRQPVMGNPRSGTDVLSKPIQVDGQTVGWITLVPFQQVSTGAALRFQEQQLKAGWVIAGLALLLAAAVAWRLAQMFIAPLKKITASTHRLATGDYRTRVDVASSDEVGQLAADFNQLALTLEKNEQLRRSFMADVSHELRTPLSVLKGELEALEDGVRPLSMETMQSLRAEVDILGKLISDLYELSLSDVGALTYRKQRLDVVALLRGMLPGYRDKLTGKDIRLDLRIGSDEHAEIYADPDRLRQLFGNLMENAVRYTDAGGTLQIAMRKEAGTDVGNGGQVTLDFEDSKPGVADDALPLLFERFYRGDASRNRATGGAGLGLSISRNIVEAHQGSISARASTLGGLWMAVSLPLANGLSAGGGNVSDTPTTVANLTGDKA